MGVGVCGWVCVCVVFVSFFVMKGGGGDQACFINLVTAPFPSCRWPCRPKHVAG